MRDRDSGVDDTSTESYREEQGRAPLTGENGMPTAAPSLGASIRGPIGREGAPNDSSASPGADADRDVAREQGDRGTAESMES